MPLFRHRLSAGQIVDVTADASTLQRPLPRSLRVVFVGPTSGVVSASLGSLFAQRRSDDVVLFDVSDPAWTASEYLGVSVDDPVGESRMAVFASRKRSEEVKRETFVSSAGLNVIPVASRDDFPSVISNAENAGRLFAITCMHVAIGADISSIEPFDVLVVCGTSSRPGKNIAQRIAEHYSSGSFTILTALVGAREQRTLGLTAGSRYVPAHLLPRDSHLAKDDVLRPEKLSAAYVEALTVLGAAVVDSIGRSA